MLQVSLIEAERVGIDLLERCVPELCLLQVDQEVGVDWTTLNKTHAVGLKHWVSSVSVNLYIFLIKERKCRTIGNWLDIEVLQEDSQALTCSLYCKFTGTVHLIKRETCKRAWSTEMSYFGNFKHGSKRSLTWCIFADFIKSCQKTARVEHPVIPQPFACLTVKPSGAARDQNAALVLSLHVWKESLDGLDGSKEVDLHNPPYRVQGLNLQRPHQTHAGIAHCE